MGLTNKNCEESEVDLMPDGWKTKKLGQLVRKFVNGGTPTTLKKEYWTGSIPWISGADVVGQKVNIIRRFITKDAVENSSTNIINKGNLLVVSRTGVGKFAIAPFDVAISQDLTGIYTDESTLLPEYLFRYLDFNQKALHTQNQGTSIQGITRETLSEIRISLPDTSEQTAIATALSDTDALIENLEKLIAKKRNIKQGVMQELLTGKKRLAGFNGKWVTIKIGEVADIHKGNGLSKTKLKQAGEYGCILYGELFTTYKRIIKNAISHTDYEEGVYSKAGDILMPGSTTTTGIDLAIASAVLKDNILLGGDINVIRPKTASINSIFLAYYITEVLKHKILELTQGITIIHLYGKDLKTLEIAIPEISEQDAIGKILVDIDEELLGLEKQMNKYQLIKQGMMQTLLTGKIRLV